MDAKLCFVVVLALVGKICQAADFIPIREIKPGDWMWRYEVHNDKMLSFADAKKVCATMDRRLSAERRSGRLATITADRNIQLKNAIAYNKGGPWWVSGSDELNEGTWYWATTGQQITGWTNWAPGQPDNYKGNENCMTVGGLGKYLWNDEPCSYLHHFICEVYVKVRVVPSFDPDV